MYVILLYCNVLRCIVLYCRASHTGDAIRVVICMYSSVSVGVVHVLGACAQVQSTVWCAFHTAACNTSFCRIFVLLVVVVVAGVGVVVVVVVVFKGLRLTAGRRPSNDVWLMVWEDWAEILRANPGSAMLNWGRHNAQCLPLWKQSGPTLSAVGPILGLCWAKLGFTHRHFRAPHKPLSHTNTLTRKRFYTQILYHTNTFTHNRCHFYTQTLLHKRFYTETETLLHKHFYTQTRLHANAFTHRLCYTQKLLLTHKHASMQTLLHTNSFTHKHTTLLHKHFYT